METKMQRQKSLKKLHFYIANYNPTNEEKLAVKSAQNELKQKIQAKFKKSTPNQTYVFPRKCTIQQEYSSTVEIVDLTQQHNHIQENLQTAEKPKLKIKLARPKPQNQTNFEQYQKTFQQNQFNSKTDKSTLAFLNNYKTSNPTTSIKGRLKTQFHTEKDNQPAYTHNLRMKTQHSASKENYFTRAIKIVDTDLSIHGSLERENSGQRSKSKLNMLTKSYMNLKTSILDKEKIQINTCNTIRSNDYKLMPNKKQQNYLTNKSSILGLKNNINKMQECYSNRVLSNCTNQLHRLTNFKNSQSCEKMKLHSQKPPQVTYNDKKFFKVK